MSDSDALPGLAESRSLTPGSQARPELISALPSGARPRWFPCQCGPLGQPHWSRVGDGLWGEALEEVDVLHLIKRAPVLDEWALLRPSRSASADFGGQPSLKPRLASRSFNEGWWRWRESNPRPRAFSEQSLHAYPIRWISRTPRSNRQGRCAASPVRISAWTSELQPLPSLLIDASIQSRRQNRRDVAALSGQC